MHVYPDKPLDLGPSEGIRGAGVKVWIEDPEYRREQNRVDPNDLGALWRKVGRIQERCLSLGFKVTLVRPSGWKGSLPKTIHHDRIRKELSPTEKHVIEMGVRGVAEGQRHNVWDAVCGYVWAAKKELERIR
jgi:hypothetical protein